MAGRDTGAALVLLIGAVLLLWFVIPAQTIPGDEGELAQSFMPSLAAVTILAAAALILVRAAAGAVRKRQSGAAPNPPAESGTAPAMPEEAAIGRPFWMVLGGTVLGFSIILALLELFGFLAGSAAGILIFGLAFRRRSLVTFVVLAVLLPAASYVLALHGLGLALP